MAMAVAPAPVFFVATPVFPVTSAPTLIVIAPPLAVAPMPCPFPVVTGSVDLTVAPASVVMAIAPVPLVVASTALAPSTAAPTLIVVSPLVFQYETADTNYGCIFAMNLKPFADRLKSPWLPSRSV
jgi:hypothetical protein